MAASFCKLRLAFRISILYAIKNAEDFERAVDFFRAASRRGFALRLRAPRCRVLLGVATSSPRAHAALSKLVLAACRLMGQCRALPVEMRAVAVAVVTLTLSFRSASGFGSFAISELRCAMIWRRSLPQRCPSTRAS